MTLDKVQQPPGCSLFESLSLRKNIILLRKWWKNFITFFTIGVPITEYIFITNFILIFIYCILSLYIGLEYRNTLCIDPNKSFLVSYLHLCPYYISFSFIPFALFLPFFFFTFLIFIKREKEREETQTLKIKRRMTFSCQ